MSKLRRQQTPVPAGFGKSLSRSETLQRAVRDAHAELERRLEPLMEHAGSAVDELNFLFDPGAIDETLLQQHQAAPAAEVGGVAGAGAEPHLPPAACMSAPANLHRPTLLQPQSQLPKSKSAAAALEAVQAVAEEKAEASLERVGGSLIDPKKIMLKDKLAFVFGAGLVAAGWVACTGGSEGPLNGRCNAAATKRHPSSPAPLLSVPRSQASATCASQPSGSAAGPAPTTGAGPVSGSAALLRPPAWR